jgi:mannitol/fructose-specific phosphotransferase system IIA component (Ntr-type)
VNLSDYIAPEDIRLDLQARTRTDLFREIASLFRFDGDTEAAIRTLLERREAMGSTGIGRGIAVPHCRTPLVPRLRVLYGRRPGGIEFDAVDGAPVEHFFVLVAPPVETSNEYLPVLGRVARLAKEADVPDRLRSVTTSEEFLRLLADKKL